VKTPKKDHITLSKFMSYVLRHKPDAIGLFLDSEGWAKLDEMVAACVKAKQPKGIHVTRQKVIDVAMSDDKKRYSIKTEKDVTYIRACQGHSVKIDLGYPPKEPPNELFHGTAEHNLTSIMKNGVVRGERTHVHLSKDRATSKKVGKRYGKPVILRIDAKQMHEDGIEFYEADNGTWLVEGVPAKYITPENAKYGMLDL